MEEQLVQLLAATQSASLTPRKHAEEQLEALRGHQDFSIGLVNIASHENVPQNIRQAALLYLKTFVLAHWSDQLEEYQSQVAVSDENKARIRQMLLDLATSDQVDRKTKSAASYVLSKIASADFPEQWPDLLPQLMHIIPSGTDAQVHGALGVLGELVDDCFNETQFFSIARDLVKVVYDVAVNESRKPSLRALAVSVFRDCFDILEMVMEDHKGPVKQFADEVLNQWNHFFLTVMKSRLPDPPSEAEEEESTPNAELYKGLVALKLQVVKVLMRIRGVFPAILSPQTPALFSATWDELSSLQGAYAQMYIQEERQSRLEDADGLPYTLDFLVLEELDFMQACLRAPPVRAELEQQLRNAQSPESTWVTEVMKLAVAYAHITTEEEGLWNVDVNIFLSEETSVTANYTPRTACGDLVIKLGEWQTQATVEGLLSYTRSLYSTNQSWKAKEAALYILNQLLCDFSDVDKQIGAEAATGFVDFIQYAMQQTDPFLRARGYLVAGSLTRTSGGALNPVAGAFLEASLTAIPSDASEVVQVSCIRALQYYLQTLPRSVTQPLQEAIVSAIATYLQGQDLQELAESDDLMVTVVETLRDTIFLDPRICITGSGLDLLFQVASHAANNFQLTMIVNEAFEEVTEMILEMRGDAYTNLCAKVLPSLTAAFDVGDLTGENHLMNVNANISFPLSGSSQDFSYFTQNNALDDEQLKRTEKLTEYAKLAADLLAILAEKGPEPLPQGFVQATMPKLKRVLLGSTVEELLKSATTAVKNILAHDHQQLFEWHDEQGKGGLEVLLIIIDHLLSPSVNDHAAGEVGALAAEVVEKAGHERLGPFLESLLRAVAVRLGGAVHAAFIQSLTLVFVRLSLTSAPDVLDFLFNLNIEGTNGLQVVLAKWLENSINFAGYDEIRQNVIALSKLYDLKDSRLRQIEVKGDLIVNNSGRIMTRSQTQNSKPDSVIFNDSDFSFGHVSNHIGLYRQLTFGIDFSAIERELIVPADPDKYTTIPATLKILKVLIMELQSASGANEELEAAVAAGLDEEGSDDDDWEDEPAPFMGVGGAGLSKEQLMAFAADDGPGVGRQRDDETQAFLVDFFHRASTTQGFEEEFAALTEEEQGRLRELPPVA